jgi:hypothetical protein
MGDVRKPSFERAGSRHEARGSLMKRVQHEVLLHSPSKNPVSLVETDSRRLWEIQKETDQSHRTETVKTGLSAAQKPNDREIPSFTSCGALRQSERRNFFQQEKPIDPLQQGAEP